MSPRIEPVPAIGNRPDVQQVLDQAAAFSGGAENILLTMAKYPGLLHRFSGMIGKLLAGGKVPPRERELVILRVAWRCRSEYEWGQHVRMGRAAGLSEDEIQRIASDDSAWSPEDDVLIRAADELIVEHCVGPVTWKALAGRYDEQQLIEFVIVIGAYVMVAGFLNSLEIEREPGLEGFPGNGTV